MRGKWTLGSLAGIGAAALCLLAFADWFLRALPQPPPIPMVRDTALFLATSFLGDSRGTALYNEVRVALAAVAGLGAAVAIVVFIRARANPAARQAAWILVGYSAFTWLAHFGSVDPRYAGGMNAALPMTAWLGVLGFLVAAVARFLVIFPRPIDSESVLHWYLRRRKRRAAPSRPRSIFLVPWHRGLVSGHMLWIAPGAIILAHLALEGAESAAPWSGWGGVAFTLIVVAAGWLVLIGFPFAYASTSHLHANGSAEERRRVTQLRAVLLASAMLVGMMLAAAAAIALLSRAGSPERAIMQAFGALALAVLFLPTFVVAGIAAAVLYGGALDPRLAFQRVTIWSLLGFGLTILFLFVERVIAVKVVQWLALPQEAGLVAAGGVIAATFVPLRQITERGVTRLGERYLPLEVIAGGARVERAVAITDLSGYTALAAHDESRALLLGALLKRQAERIVAPRGGKVVKSMGDAVMLTFADAARAVSAVQQLHLEYPHAALTAGVEPLPLHSSIHYGEIVESHDGDIYGQTVNVTARLVDAASAGQIVVSDALQRLLPAGVAALALGERRFKNVPDAVHCFRIEIPQGPESSVAGS